MVSASYSSPSTAQTKCFGGPKLQSQQTLDLNMVLSSSWSPLLVFEHLIGIKRSLLPISLLPVPSVSGRRYRETSFHHQLKPKPNQPNKLTTDNIPKRKTPILESHSSKISNNSSIRCVKINVIM